MTDLPGQYAIFLMGGEEFALEIAGVVEILQRQQVMHVPNMPDFLVGMIEIRGRVVPVMDLRRRFRIPPGPRSKDRIIIIRRGRERLGLLVDDVQEIVSVPHTRIAPPPTLFRGIGAEYMRGIARMDGRMIVILHIERFMQPEELSRMKEVLDHG